MAIRIAEINLRRWHPTNDAWFARLAAAEIKRLIPFLFSLAIAANSSSRATVKARWHFRSIPFSLP